MQLFIGNINIELAPGETIAFNRQNAEMGNPGGRSGSFTNDFTAPLTPTNKAAIGYSDNLQAESTFLVEKRHTSTLRNESGGEVARGFSQVVSINKRANTFTSTFFGGNTSWIELLKGKSIRDIWLWDLQHDLTEANIVGSHTNTGGYIYPFSDYGRLKDLTTSTTLYTDWYPAMYQHTLMTRMVETINYKLAGDIVDSWEYKAAIIPFVNERFEEDSEFQIPAEAEKTTTTGYDLTETPVGATSGSSTEVLDIDTVVVDELGAFNLGNDRYVATKTLNDAVFVVKIDDTTVTRSTSGATTVSFDITWSIRKNGTAVETFSLLSEVGITSPVADNTTTDDYILTATMDLVATDYVDVVVDFSYSGATNGVTNVQLLVQVANFNFQLTEVNPEIPLSGNVTLHNNLPDIDQAFFIKDLIIRTGALVTVDEYSQTIFLDYVEGLPAQASTAEDWTTRIDMGAAAEVNFSEIVSRYGKKSNFKYNPPTEDDDLLTDYNDGRAVAFGDGVMNIDNDFISGESDIYTSPFTASFQTQAFSGGASQGIYVPRIPKYDSTGAKIYKSNPRILYVLPNVSLADFNGGGTLPKSSFNIDGGGTFYTEAAVCFFDKPLMNSSIDFITSSLAYDTPPDTNSSGEGLLQKNYATWLRMIEKPRYITLGLKLWEHEFQYTDLGKIIFINNIEVQGYFLIDSIEYANGNDELRLIQIK